MFLTLNIAFMASNWNNKNVINISGIKKMLDKRVDNNRKTMDWEGEGYLKECIFYGMSCV